MTIAVPILRAAIISGGTPSWVQSHAASMLGAEAQGLALDFTDQFWLAATGHYGSAKVIDTGTPANNFDSIPDALLTYTGTTKLTRQSDGVYRYGPHNLLASSELLGATGSTGWTVNRASVVAGYADPFGGTSSVLLTEDSTLASSHRTFYTATLVAGASYQISFYAKANGRTIVYCRSDYSGGNKYAWFDLQNSTTTVEAGLTATITAVGNGWYFCTAAYSDATATSNPMLGLATAATTGGTLYDGNGTGGVYLTRAHLRRTPSDSTYLATGASPKYGLPFEWNTSGVLQGILVEPQASNLFLNNTTGATQTITVSNATAYTVSFFGTGSITFSGANSSTLNGTGATDRVSSTFTTSSTSLTCTVSGSITDVQVETGSVATSVIRTYAASATRAADSKTKATSALPWSATLGTVFVSAKTASGSGTQVLWQADDGSENNRFRIVRDSSNNLRFIVTTASSEVCNINLGTVANSTSFKVVVAWAANDFAATLNGGAVGTDASGALPTVTTVREGSSFTGEQWNSIIAKNEYLPRRMSNADMQALAT